MVDFHTFEFIIDGELKKIDISKKEGLYTAKIDDSLYHIEVSQIDHYSFLLLINNKSFVVYFTEDEKNKYIFINNENFLVSKKMQTQITEGKKIEESGHELIKAPMPGKTVKILVKENEKVKKFQPIIVIESMKMEINLSSGKEGIVKKIYTSIGKSFSPGEILAEIE